MSSVVTRIRRLEYELINCVQGKFCSKLVSRNEFHRHRKRDEDSIVIFLSMCCGLCTDTFPLVL
jgi:hypothetical protein